MKNILFAAFAVLILFAVLTPATAAPAPTSQIDFAALDRAVEVQMYKHGLPGVAISVVKDGQTIYSKGYSSAEDKHPMTVQTQMLIGSQSKSFTALAIAQLDEAVSLDLYAPVQAYIPWFRVADDAASRRITLNHLLHHTIMNM